MRLLTRIVCSLAVAVVVIGLIPVAASIATFAMTGNLVWGSFIAVWFVCLAISTAVENSDI